MKGRLRTLLIEWTDFHTPDPLITVGAGRAFFRADLLRQLRSVIDQQIARSGCGMLGKFKYGATSKAYRAVDEHVYDTVRHFLRRRHKVSSRGISQFPEERVFGSLGVIRLQGPMGVRL